MKAVVLREVGGPEVLRFEDFSDPVPGQGEVLVRVRAVGVNRIDVWIRSGLYPVKLPHILGADVAGEVEEVGEGADGVEVGEKMVAYPLEGCGRCVYCLSGRESMCRDRSLLGYHRHGGYAELVKVPAQSLFRVPGDVRFEEAAAVPVNYITAWHMLFTRGGLRAGQTVLVIGGGSGIGYAAIELAKLAGAHVITTVGAEWKVKRALEIGADYAINRVESDFAEEVMRLTGGKGVDVVFEHAGAAVWEKAVKCLKPGGVMVFAGATTGDRVEVNIRMLYGRQLNLHGSFLGERHEFMEILQLLGNGEIKPVIDSVYSLREASEAHRRMEASKHFGKIILRP